MRSSMPAARARVQRPIRCPGRSSSRSSTTARGVNGSRDGRRARLGRDARAGRVVRRRGGGRPPAEGGYRVRARLPVEGRIDPRRCRRRSGARPRRASPTILGKQEDIEVVGEAADGIEAVSLARELRPDVVLMDIRMPGRDGMEATRELAARAARNARADADHFRPERVRLRGDEGRSKRLPAQGRPP